VVRPNVLSSQLYGPSNSSFNPGKDLYLNAAAFSVPAPFTFGDAPRLFSQARAPGLREWDMALGKTFQINERFGIKFKAEFFNILNIVNFGAPVSDINNPSFGQITTAGPSRTGQISATLLF
jgi:hypothetical protein